MWCFHVYFNNLYRILEGFVLKKGGIALGSQEAKRVGYGGTEQLKEGWRRQGMGTKWEKRSSMMGPLGAQGKKWKPKSEGGGG